MAEGRAARSKGKLAKKDTSSKEEGAVLKLLGRIRKGRRGMREKSALSRQIRSLPLLSSFWVTVRSKMV